VSKFALFHYFGYWLLLHDEVVKTVGLLLNVDHQHIAAADSGSDVMTLWHYTNLLLLLFFFTLVLNSQGMKKLCYALQKSTKIKLE